MPSSRPTLPRALRNLRVLLACARGPLSLAQAAASLQIASERLASQLREFGPCTHGIAIEEDMLVFADTEDAAPRPRVSQRRKAWAHAILAQHASLPEERALHAFEAGDIRLAKEIASQLPALCERTDIEAELREGLAASALDRSTAKSNRIALARAYLALDRIQDAAKLLESLGASRARAPSTRILWARCLHRQGRYADSLRRTRALLRSRDASVAPTYILDLHARNLLLLGRGREAVDTLTRALTRPGSNTPGQELRLHLTRERCAREAGVQVGVAERTVDLALVVREARRRRDDELVARASFRVGVALSDAGNDTRALRWLRIAQSAWTARGDTYHCAEVENSVGVLLHKLLRIDEARATFERAMHRLATLHAEQARAIVQLNYADLTLDLLDESATREALRSAKNLLAEGVPRFKAELMLLENDLEHGAAPDLVLDRIEELGERAATIGRLPVLAYRESLRARAYVALGLRRRAAESFEKAAKIYVDAGRQPAAANALVNAAALQEDRSAARRCVARALHAVRHENVPLLVRVARSAIGTGAQLELRDALPLLRRRAEELRAGLEAIEAPGFPVHPDPRSDALLELARTFARARGAEDADYRGPIDRFLGPTRWALLIKGPVGRLRQVQGHAMTLAEALDTKAHVASRARIDSDRYALVLVHDERELCFGHEKIALARTLLDLLQVREAACSPARASAGETADDVSLPGQTQPAHDEKPHRPTGRSPAIDAVRRRVSKLANSMLPLVLRGESGVGKDRLARFVHESSAHAAGPFVVVDCAALPEHLAEAQLVGHERGAFTGAESERRGLLEQANGGSLILDRVERLPLRAQSLLLRAMETGRIRRLGAAHESAVRFRVITLTDRGLEHAIEEGLVRSELAWRLDGATIRIPTLAERIHDLPMLVRELVELENEGRPRAVRPSALAAMQRETWPGNITELRNRIRRALLLTPTNEALCDGLLDEEDRETPHALRDRAQHGPAPDMSTEDSRALSERLRAAERDWIADALARHSGHRERSARSLGISRRWLQKRIRDLEIEEPPH